MAISLDIDDPRLTPREKAVFRAAAFRLGLFGQHASTLAAEQAARLFTRFDKHNTASAAAWPDLL